MNYWGFVTEINVSASRRFNVKVPKAQPPFDNLQSYSLKTFFIGENHMLFLVH